MCKLDYIALGQRIRDARHELNMTQEEISEKCGISTSFYGHIERGSRKASIETLVALATSLNRSIDDLLQDSMGDFAPTDDLSNMLAQMGILLNRLKRAVRDPWRNCNW